MTPTMIKILESLLPILLSAGLTAWVYKTLNAIIDNLKADVEQLSQKIDSLELQLEKERTEKNKWYRKYQKLLGIYNKFGGCKPVCPVAQEINKHLAEEGETL